MIPALTPLDLLVLLIGDEAAGLTPVVSFQRSSCAHPTWVLSATNVNGHYALYFYFCEPDPSLRNHEVPVPGLAACGSDADSALKHCVQTVTLLYLRDMLRAPKRKEQT